MISSFPEVYVPDVNVWLALSVGEHEHHGRSMNWLNRSLPKRKVLLFTRFTHLGLMRLLTSDAVMAGSALSIAEAWQVYEVWLSDRRVEFVPEPKAIHEHMKLTTAPKENQRASKWLGRSSCTPFSRHRRIKDLGEPAGQLLPTAAARRVERR